MVTILILIVVLVAILVTVLHLNHRSMEARKRQLKVSVLEADRQMETDYRAARRRMNDRAGQSWRNLAE